MMRSVITKAIIPAVEKIRAQVAQLAATRAAERAPGVPAPPLSAADIQAVPVILLFDGEHEFLTQMIATCITELEMRPELKGWILIKLAASCSKTEQPCDVSPVFMALKALSTSKLGFKFEGGDKTQADWIEKDLLAEIPAASRRTFLNFLLHAPNIIGDALRPHNIEIGWTVSGIWPFMPNVVLAQCPRIGQLNPAQTAAILAAVKPLSVLTRENGRLTDEQMQAAVGPSISLAGLAAAPHPPPTHSTPLEDLVINRQRALILNLLDLAESSADESESDRDPDPLRDDACTWVYLFFFSLLQPTMSRPPAAAAAALHGLALRSLVQGLLLQSPAVPCRLAQLPLGLVRRCWRRRWTNTAPRTTTTTTTTYTSRFLSSPVCMDE